MSFHDLGASFLGRVRLHSARRELVIDDSRAFRIENEIEQRIGSQNQLEGLILRG